MKYFRVFPDFVLMILLVLMFCIAAIARGAPPDPKTVPQFNPGDSIIEKAKALPPGDWTWSFEDNGWVRTRDEGTGKGAGASAVGDKLNESFTGTPPEVGRMADGSQSAKGGGADAKIKADAFVPPEGLAANPCLWVGIAALAAGAFCISKGLKRPAITFAAFGAVMIAIAMAPHLILWLICGGAVIIGFPYLKAEMERQAEEAKAKKAHEAVRASIGAIYHESVPEAARQTVLNAFAKESDEPDREYVNTVKAADRIGTL